MKKQLLKLVAVSGMLLGINNQATAQWSLTGNAGTTPPSSFIGTTDLQNFVVKTNNTSRITVTSAGKVGIGTTAPTYAVDVKDTGVTSFRVQSTLNGSSNCILARALGTTNCLVNYKTGATQVWNTGCSGNDDFSIIDALNKKRFVISQATGNVGIGTNAPTAKLEVAGQIKITGGSPGLGKVLSSNASGLASWSDLNTLGGWSVNGNSGINSATQFIGTTDSADFIVRTNGSESMKVFPNLPMNNGAPVLPVDVLRISRDGTNNNKWNGAASFQLGSFGSDVYANTQLDIALNDEGSPSYPYVKVMSLLSNGNVGIGVTSPSAKLDVNGIGKFGDYLKIGTDVSEGYFQNAQDGAYRALQTGGDQGYWFQNFNGVKTTMYVGLNGTYAGNVGIGTTTPLANLHITNPGLTSKILLGESNLNGGYTAFEISTSANAGGYCNLQAIKSAGSAWGDIVLNRDGGSVAIGTTKVATGYKLSVNGSIMCTALRVQDFASWPDYVFAKDYDLKSLSEVESYIAANKRLPGMPSDCEVMENGIDVGQMQAKVVEKVEENTLYIIQLSKENQELRAQLKAIQTQLSAMQK